MFFSQFALYNFLQKKKKEKTPLKSYVFRVTQKFLKLSVSRACVSIIIIIIIKISGD